MTTKHVALIHTVPALAATFDARILAEFAERFPGGDTPRIDHIVDPWLLAEATRRGVTDEIAARVAEHAAYLAREGARLVLVTCSSIGGTAAEASERAGIPVLRVDAPIARQAV
jgi:aspartate/glutamate racemase